MTVALGFDFHMTSTSKGSVRRYSYIYKAKRRISDTSADIFRRLAHSCSPYMNGYKTSVQDSDMLSSGRGRVEYLAEIPEGNS